MTDGKFIVFEGLDGSGKTTLVGEVADLLYYGPPVVTAEPALGCVYYDTIRAILNARTFANVGLDSKSDMLGGLFAQNRHDHLEKIVNPALSEDLLVLCDRYMPSSLVYQAATKEEQRRILHLNRGIRVPDLTIILDTDPEVCAERVDTRDGYNRELYEARFNEYRRRYLDVSRILSDLGWNIYISDTQQDTPETLVDLILSL